MTINLWMTCMFDIIKIIIGFILTGIIGTFLAQYYQKKNFIYQTKIIKLQKEIERLKELADNIEKLAGMRIFYGRNLIDNCSEKESKEFSEARKQYRASVEKWNENLSSFFIELRSLGLTTLAFDLEKNVHNNLRKAHLLIDELIRKNNKVDISKIGHHYSMAFDGLRYVSKNIMIETDRKWDTIISGNSELLNKYNLSDAGIGTLIIAIFHKNPHLLRIRRSGMD